jgi:hypothetical protein
MQSGDSKLAISVILPTSDDFSTVRRTVSALHAQTVRHLIELVLVSPTDDPGVIASEVEGFAAVKLVNGGPLQTSNISRAAGIRNASAPLVVLAEDHCFPERRWAEALIDAHRDDYAVVGPVLSNGNPHSMMSWANLLLEYGPWLEGAPRAELDSLPGHNSAYKRDLLLAYGDKFEALFEVEDVIQADMRSKGHRMLLTPFARTDHFNFSRLGPSLNLRFNAGRSFAGHRIMGWSFGKRLAYLFGAPLIPVVRLSRIVKLVRSSDRYRWLFPRVLPMLALALLVDGLGELTGYLTGPGDSARILGGIEFDRRRFMKDEDRHDWDEALARLEVPETSEVSRQAMAV